MCITLYNEWSWLNFILKKWHTPPAAVQDSHSHSTILFRYALLRKLLEVISRSRQIWRATLHVRMVAANNLHAISTFPTQAQSRITFVMVKPPVVNCQWPQDWFESSSSISLEFGSAASMRLRNAATLSDGAEDLKSGEAAIASTRAIACGIGGCWFKNSSGIWKVTLSDVLRNGSGKICSLRSAVTETNNKRAKCKMNASKVKVIEWTYSQHRLVWTRCQYRM